MYAHAHTRTKRARARMCTHARYLYTCCSSSSSSVENVKNIILQRNNVNIKHFLMLKELLKNR